MKKNQELKLTEVQKIEKLKLSQIKYFELFKGVFLNNKIKVTKNTIDRSEECGSFVLFKATEKLDKYKIHNANFCKHRFCPMCAKRKALKDALALTCMIQYVEEIKKRQFIFLTLTVPNIVGDGLDNKIREMNKGWQKLIRREKFIKAVHGYVKKLEVTFNEKEHTYHPHFHVLLSVDRNYFTNPKKYLKHSEWLNEWCAVMDDESITQVDIRTFRKKNEKPYSAVNELTKYIAKDSNYLISEDVFVVFYQALTKKRMFTFGGDFKKARDLYKKGELDYYIEQDETLWYWLISMRWVSGNKYQEFQKEVLKNQVKDDIKQDLF